MVTKIRLKVKATILMKRTVLNTFQQPISTFKQFISKMKHPESFLLLFNKSHRVVENTVAQDG